MTDPIGAVVLAGGRSARFGRDKLVEPVDGRPLLEHAVDAVRSVATDIVVVVAPDTSLGIPPGIRVAHDRAAYEGPLAGLAGGLGALQPAVERVVVVGGDMPTLVPAVLARLLEELDRCDVAVLADDAGPRPLPMAVRRSTTGPAIERSLAGGERRLRALLDEVAVCLVPPATWRAIDPDGTTLLDVDVPADLPG